jgi:hypothetical protein
MHTQISLMMKINFPIEGRDEHPPCRIRGMNYPSEDGVDERMNANHDVQSTK